MKKTIVIEGMMCGHCTGRVKKALEAAEGITNAEMSLENKTAQVECEEAVTDAMLRQIVETAGYQVTDIR